MKVRGDRELRHLIFGDMHLTPLQMHFLWNILMVLFLHQVQPSGSNPWNLLVHSGYREQSWNSAQSLIGVTQKLDMITLGLTANIKFSWDASNNTLQVRSKTPPQFHATGRNEDGSLNYKTIYEGSNNLSYAAPVTVSKITTYMEGSLNYTRLFAQKHRIGALFLYNHKIYKLLTAENQKKSITI